jgi:hypothetical protein
MAVNKRKGKPEAPARKPSTTGRYRASRTNGLAFRAAAPEIEDPPKPEESLLATLDDMQAQMDALRAHVASLAQRDAPSNAVRAFAEELDDLLQGEAPDPDSVRRAARLALAQQAWEQRLGTLLETRDVMELLGVSRQRVSALAKDHRVIALAEQGRLRFPAWQFADMDARDRSCLATAHETLVDVGGISPWSAAAWFRTPHPELEDRDPIAWLHDHGDRDRLRLVAHRDAARAAR